MSCHKTIVGAIAALVRARYVFPEVADRVATHLEFGLRTGMYDILDPNQLALRLTEELRIQSSDTHLRVRYSEEPHIDQTPGDVAREQNDRAQHCLDMNYGIVGFDLNSQGIAVLTINELVEPELSRIAYETVLNSAVSAKALVIDLRRCVGGDPSTVALVCSHLFDEPTQLSSIAPRLSPVEKIWADPRPYPNRFGSQKPVFIVVANFTFSGAEMLAYDLQSCGRAIGVGSTTGGGANLCSFHWPSPHFSLLLPEATSINPVTGTNWEGCGVTPDVLGDDQHALELAIALAHHR